MFTAACQAMCEMDLTAWLSKITSPALVLGGDEDLMTPWDQGPGGVGQEGIYQAIANAEKHVVRGLEPLDDLRRDGRARSRGDRLLHAPQPSCAVVPAIEEYGVEPIPAELRTVGWRDLFAINFTFFLNPVMYLLGAFAVVDGGLPLWWAVAAMVVGQALAYALLVIVAQPGVDYGLPGQVGDACLPRLLGRTAS